MNKLKKYILLGLLLSMLSACSYTPKLLKESYAELPSSMAKELKEPFSHLSKQQSAMIDNYTSELFKWHRKNKLPSYAQAFAKLAKSTEQGKLKLSMLQQIMIEIEGMPHVNEATQLTPMMASFSLSLSPEQITQLDKYLKSKSAEGAVEIENNDLSKEIVSSLDLSLKFIDIRLDKKQQELITKSSRNLHDTRPLALLASKHWNEQMITLLKNKHVKNYKQKFAELWNNQEKPFSSTHKKYEQQNKYKISLLIKSLIDSFNPEQKKIFIKNNFSISKTFAEMQEE